MKILKELLTDCKIIKGQNLLDQTAENITQNSKLVNKKTLFLAEKGHVNDGHDYILDAIQAGAIGLIVEDLKRVPDTYQGVVATVASSRNYAGPLAARFYNNPSDQLFCLGITGTNGKTSTTYIAEWLWNAVHQPTGVIGTINHHLKSKIWETNMTTPDPILLQSRLHDFVREGATHLAMEVSSHALEQKRISSINFDTVLFTNLTRDHLDYHLTMENYFNSKLQFFTEVLSRSTKTKKAAFINADDPWGAQIFDQKLNYPIYRFGQSSQFELYFQLKSMNFQGTTFELKTPWGSGLIKSPLIGIHNIYNVVGTIGVCLFNNVSFETIQANLISFPGIPGRLQAVQNQKNKSIFVDYAHTPDALENVLKSLSELRSNSKLNSKIITVFGCGGDRDAGKRPLMAQIAEKYSDSIFVTSDNPRTESPDKILQEICIGIKNKSFHCIENRRDAIAQAIQSAQPQDVVLIAGKGHETYQIIGKEKFYFNDYEVAQEFL